MGLGTLGGGGVRNLVAVETPCLCFFNAGIRGMGLHSWFYAILGIEASVLRMPGRPSTN